MERDKYASKRALRVTNVALIILLIIVLLFWWRGSSNFQFKGVNPGQISIRQQDGKIQYQFLDGEWQDITSVASLRGEKGADGKMDKMARTVSMERMALMVQTVLMVLTELMVLTGKTG